jgi:hypothetical protein
VWCGVVRCGGLWWQVEPPGDAGPGSGGSPIQDRGRDELKEWRRWLYEHHRNLVRETSLAEFGALAMEGDVVVDPAREGRDEEEDENEDAATERGEGGGRGRG